MQKYVAEFLGTFFLVLAIGLTGDPVASGFLIIAIVYTGGSISGAHYNPAVTFAFWVSRGTSPGLFLRYVTAQLTGSLTGILFIYFLTGSIFRITPSFSSTPLQYSLVEVVFTFILAMVYLTVFLSKSFRGNHVYGLVIGLSYAGLLIIAEPVSGAVFNPALAAAAALIDLFIQGESWIYLPAYILAPLAGGLIAGYLFNFFENE